MCNTEIKNSNIDIIIGLGNVGSEYKTTRHNIGFMTLDFFLKDKQYKTLNYDLFSFTTVNIFGRNIFCIKPLCYMNNSGVAILQFLESKNLSYENMLIIHDDIDIKFGKLVLSLNRGDGGHKGIRSIIEHLKSKNFSRLRVGIGCCNNENLYTKPDTTEYVTSNFDKNEIDNLDYILKKSVNSIEFILKMDLYSAMNIINK